MTNAAALNAIEPLLQKRLNRSAADRDLHGRSESHSPPCRRTLLPMLKAPKRFSK